MRAVGQDDDVEHYFRTIAAFQLLTSDEEITLAKEIESGVDARARLSNRQKRLEASERRQLERTVLRADKARCRFITANLRFVVTVARRQRIADLPLIDVIQFGNIGLIKAVDKFDWRRNYRFTTVAAWWIRQAIGVGTEQTARVIRLPRNAREQLTLLVEEALRIEQSGGTATAQHIALALSLELPYVRRVLEWPTTTWSLDQPLGVDGTTPLESLQDRFAESTEDVACNAALIGALRRRIDELPPIQRKVVSTRYGLAAYSPSTVRQTAASLGVSERDVRQLEEAAIHALRSTLVEAEPDAPTQNEFGNAFARSGMAAAPR